jgi:exopolysaccharide biosynthesis polyprenyl glycosylphosphotransferase
MATAPLPASRPGTDVDELTQAAGALGVGASAPRRRSLVRRMLVVADVVGLTTAFILALALFGSSGDGSVKELALFLATLPAWILLANLYGLYDQDETRANHSTLDELVGVFHLVTVGAWLTFGAAWLSGLAEPSFEQLGAFWAVGVGFVAIGRAAARGFCRRRAGYMQNALVVGAGEVGQLVARKLLHHPEYGINLLGFVDPEPTDLPDDVAHLGVLGSPELLPQLVRDLNIDRVIVAFSSEGHERTLDVVRLLKRLGVQVDIVPRLFEAVGPNVGIHAVEGVPLVGLPPARSSRVSRVVKRAIDVVGAVTGLVLTALLFLYIAWRIKRDSPGPVFYRQTRLGMEMRPFTLLKFRTMRDGTGSEDHAEYIRRVMDRNGAPVENGLYKLDRPEVTDVGRWLRRTSLDELPQLWNVLRGQMSLVGPRPCLAYETEHFAPHHFERFLVPAGLTGLWQVTARAHSTFVEALEMDVAYTRAWSLGLDLSLLCRTPLQLFRKAGTA